MGLISRQETECLLSPKFLLFPKTGCTQMVCAPWLKFQQVRDYQSQQAQCNTKSTSWQNKAHPQHHTFSRAIQIYLLLFPFLGSWGFINTSSSFNSDWFQIRMDIIVVSGSSIIVQSYLGKLVKFLVEKEDDTLPLLLIHLPVLSMFTPSQLKFVTSLEREKSCSSLFPK